MASLTKDNRLRFMCPTTGIRKTIRLGEMSKTNARAFHVRVERLIDCATTGEQPDADTRAWLQTIAPALREKLTLANLLGAGNGIPTGLESFADAFTAAHGAVAASTKAGYKQAKARAVEYFGKARDIKTITVGDACAFSNWLRLPKPKDGQPASDKTTGPGMGENTARDMCKQMRAMLGWAVKCELIAKNPFADKSIQKASLPAAAAKVHLLPVADSLAILEACRANKDWELAAMFALCRWGGLRIGETRLLTWEHVDFDKARLTVLSPKTAGKGKESREVPLFPELASALAELQSHAPEREKYLFPVYNGKTAEWSFKCITAAIKRAGVAAYKRPWHNLRVTRITELVESRPAHVVNAWMGNTEAVSVACYRKVTDEHFAAAVEGIEAKLSATKNAAQNPAHLTQKAAQMDREPAGTGNKKTPVLPGIPATSYSGNSYRYPQQESNLRPAT